MFGRLKQKTANVAGVRANTENLLFPRCDVATCRKVRNRFVCFAFDSICVADDTHTHTHSHRDRTHFVVPQKCAHKPIQSLFIFISSFWCFCHVSFSAPLSLSRFARPSGRLHSIRCVLVSCARRIASNQDIHRAIYRPFQTTHTLACASPSTIDNRHFVSK